MGFTSLNGFDVTREMDIAGRVGRVRLSQSVSECGLLVRYLQQPGAL